MQSQRSKRKLLRRVFLHEYLPWAGAIAAWVLVALGLGTRETAMIAAALLLVNSARSLTQVNTASLLLRYPPQYSGESMWGRSPAHLRLVRLVNLAALGTALSLVAAAAWLLSLGRLHHLGEIALLIAVGLPARYAARMTGRPRSAGAGRFRSSLSWSGAALVGVSLLLGLGWQGAALALGLREWIACLSIFVPLRPRAGTTKGATGRVPDAAWHEIIVASHKRARRRFASRAARSLLAGLLGPLGSGLARTGRAARLDRRMAGRVPEGRAPVALLGASLFGAGIALLLRGSAVWQMLLAASLIRISAAAAGLLFWTTLARNVPPETEAAIAAGPDFDDD